MSGMIMGAGIGGLATAIALQNRGMTVNLFEAAPALAPIGAGILVPPNAMNLLTRYGLAEQVQKAGKPIDAFAVLDRRGNLISQLSAHFEQDGASHQAVAIHRGQLQQILLNALTENAVRLNKSCVQITTHENRVEAAFADGTTSSGSFVVGADGLRSSVRQSLFPHSRLRYSGQTCWRGLVTTTLPTDWGNRLTEIWNGCGVFGCVPINQSQVYWFATHQTTENGVDDSSLLKQRLIAMHGKAIEPIATMIAHTDLRQIIRNDLFDLAPLKSWVDGKVVLIGDAAHAALPNLGQGGAQAIEDAWMLAKMLGTYKSPEAAFAHFQAARFRRARKIASMSRDVSRISGLCNTVLCSFRDQLFRALPSSLSLRQFRALYHLPY